MRVARASSVCLIGLEARVVEVEVCFGSALPRTGLVGLATLAVQEARERCKAAVAAVGLAWPSTAVTINLSPADLPKGGSQFDVPIVAALLVAAGTAPAQALESTVYLGELGLDGRVRPVKGALAAVVSAQRQGFSRVVLPMAQLREARLVEGIATVGVRHLTDLVAVMRGQPMPDPEFVPAKSAPEEVKDLADVVGQAEACFAATIAAVGGHHLALSGPPGVGKTLLAERLVGLLPDLAVEESLEVSSIHSLTGTSLAEGLIRRPPYADPHHTASVAAIVGGGSRVAVPGAVSRAHRGVLFLDEAPEFSPRALDALRQPLESGYVVHARSDATTTYPARFMLVVASNPCPCGWYGTSPAGRCQCRPLSIRRYAERLSGPILDRLDLQVRLRPLRQSQVRAAEAVRGPSTAEVRAQVGQARERQRARLAAYDVEVNGAVPGPVLRRRLPLPGGMDAVERAVQAGQLSARGVDKVLRVAWSIADLVGHDVPTATDVRTALGLRRGESEA